MATFNQPTALPTPTDDYYSSFSNKIHHTHSFSSTTGTPSAQSPTSPRTVSSSPNQSFQHAAFKHDQLRKPKTPLYIPAVLRPTEFHSSCGRFNTSAPSTSAGLKTSNSSAAVTAKNNPAGLLTPPSSAGTSFDSQDGSLAAKMMAQQSSVVGFGDDYKTFLNRMVSDEWNEDMMEEVTGAPTQDHWKVCLVNFFFPRSGSMAAAAPWTRRHGEGGVFPTRSCSIMLNFNQSSPAKNSGQSLLIYKWRAGGFTIWHNNHEIHIT